MSAEQRKRRNSQLVPCIVFVGPAVLTIIVLMVVPIVIGLSLSFTRYYFLRPNEPILFTGIKNYLEVLQDQFFQTSVLWTIQFAVSCVIINLLIGLFIAWLLNRRETEKSRHLFTTLFILPIMIAGVVAASIWYIIFAPVFGLINGFLTQIGTGTISWFGQPGPAKLCLIITEAWLTTPFCVLVLVAAFQGVPQDLYESAQIEGTGAFKEFFYITLPLTRNAISLVLSIRLMDSLRAFDIIYSLTKGGPGTATETLGTYIYKQGFKYFETSKGVSAAFLLFIFVAVITLLNLRITRREIDY
jgi:multiple sugar transport system permease protein